MIFADLPVAEAAGALLVHSLRVGKLAFRKGRVLSATDIQDLADAGRATVTVARLELGDVGENEAAARLAAALGDASVAAATAFTGRCNLFAQTGGVVLRARRPLRPHYPS